MARESLAASALQSLPLLLLRVPAIDFVRAQQNRSADSKHMRPDAAMARDKIFMKRTMVCRVLSPFLESLCAAISGLARFQARLWLDLDMLGVAAGRSATGVERRTRSHNGVVAACALQCLSQLELLRGGK